jgi:hypothetical protein
MNIDNVVDVQESRHVRTSLICMITLGILSIGVLHECAATVEYLTCIQSLANGIEHPATYTGRAG